MPRLVEFTAPDGKPFASAISALETAGRRIGPLFNEMAQAAKAEGALKVQARKDSLWPLDILKLVEAGRASSQGSEPGTIKGGFSGVRFRVVGGGEGFGGPTETWNAFDTPSYRTHGQVSRGAGALGQLVNDGGYGAGSTLGHGQLDNGGYPRRENLDGTVGGYGYNPSPAQLALDKYNGEREKALQEYSQNLVNQRDYWQQYYHGDQYSTTPKPMPDQFGGGSDNQYPSAPTPAETSSGIIDGLRNLFNSGSADQAGVTGGL